MALIERLMGVMPNGNLPGEGEDERKIPVHGFFALANEIIRGKLTAANVKALTSMETEVDASGYSDTGDFDALIAQAPPANNLAARALYLITVQSVCLIAELKQYPGYMTPSEIRTNLGIA